MAFFRCSKCGCAEDTALCRYWSARLREVKALCSACDPDIGKWHAEFPRESYEMHKQREIDHWLEMAWVENLNRKLTPPAA